MISKLSKNCCKKEEKPFPKLMIYTDGDVILFEEEGKETYVYKSGRGATVEIGTYISSFNMGGFKDYEGDVCLSNGE